MLLPLSISPSISGIHSRCPDSIWNKLVFVLVGVTQGDDGSCCFRSGTVGTTRRRQQCLGIWLQRLGQRLQSRRRSASRPGSSDVRQLIQHLSRCQREIILFRHSGLLVGRGGVA